VWLDTRRTIRVLRTLSLFIALALILTGCNSAGTQAPTADANQILRDAVVKIRGAESFRMLVEQVGADFVFSLVMDASGTAVTAVMERAEAQFVPPDEVFAKVKLTIGIITTDVEIYAKGADQWLRVLPAPWLNIAFAAGFNPGDLVAEGSGFEKALSALQELNYVGEESLVDGTPTYHITGKAGGEIVKDLLVGLVETASDVAVDAYIHRETGFPALVVVTIPDSGSEAQPEDTAWRVELYDYNAAVDFQAPQG
jgi:hypothetical protein